METPGQKAAAISDLSSYLAAQDSHFDPWHANIGKFLTGQMPEKDFISSAQSDAALKTNKQLCEAYFFSAAMRDLAGDKAGAADLYQKCIGTGLQDFSGYQIAKARLAAH